MAVNHKAINDLNDLKDRIDIWIMHNRQPNAYHSGADTLGDLAGRLAIIAGENLVFEAKGE